jgi:hypothetical protein
MSGLRCDESSISSKLGTAPDLATGKSAISGDGDPSDNVANSDSDVSCSDADDNEWIRSASSSSHPVISSNKKSSSPQEKGHQSTQENI